MNRTLTAALWWAVVILFLFTPAALAVPYIAR